MKRFLSERVSTIRRRRHFKSLDFVVVARRGQQSCLSVSTTTHARRRICIGAAPTAALAETETTTAATTFSMIGVWFWWWSCCCCCCCCDDSVSGWALLRSVFSWGVKLLYGNQVSRLFSVAHFDCIQSLVRCCINLLVVAPPRNCILTWLCGCAYVATMYSNISVYLKSPTYIYIESWKAQISRSYTARCTIKYREVILEIYLLWWDTMFASTTTRKLLRFVACFCDFATSTYAFSATAAPPTLQINTHRSSRHTIRFTGDFGKFKFHYTFSSSLVYTRRCTFL